MGVSPTDGRRGGAHDPPDRGRSDDRARPGRALVGLLAPSPVRIGSS